jgi:uncharacterized membrane protein
MHHEDPTARRRRLGLAALLGVAGTMHFVTPRFFDDIVPSWMPGTPRTVTYLSGVAELACAGLVASRRTARVGGWTALAVFVGVYPANLQMVVDAGRPQSLEEWAVWLRAPVQVPLFLWARRVARDAVSRPA